MLRTNRTEKILYLFSFLVLVIAVGHLYWQFYDVNSEMAPAIGGTYTEGVVGQVNFINPLLAHSNTIEADITKLVYSGLTMYDPKTGNVIPDLATFTLDTTKKKYTFVLNEKAVWHDGQKVIADDVIFTYEHILQNEEFKNPILQATFKDIKIKKIDDRTIEFTLKEPYYFFPTSTTIGILPKHIWSDVPVKNLDKSEYNLMPIGSGPYKFVRHTPVTEKQKGAVDLQLNTEYYGKIPYIQGITFKIFPTMEDLQKSNMTVDAINEVPYEILPQVLEQDHLQEYSYTLPQYVALFLNMQSSKLVHKNVRLALQLGTDKKNILQNIQNVRQVDTPFLELKNDNSWLYQPDKEKAQGALYDANWRFKKAETSLLPSRLVATTDLPTTTYAITEPNNGVDYTTNTSEIVIRGTNPITAKSIIVNGYTLQRFVRGKGSWSYVANVSLGTLKKGVNTYNVSYIDENDKKVFLDSITITYDPGYTPTANTNQNVTLPPENNNNNISETTTPVNSNTNTVVTSTNTNTNENTATSSGSTVSTSSGAVVETPPLTDIDLVPENLRNAIRYNTKGDPLVLKLITTKNPPEFRIIVDALKKEWLEIGIYLHVTYLSSQDIFTAIQAKEYDIILYGQSLEYNIDTFPYWHSSQSTSKGLNLAQFKSFEADALLEEIRNPYLNKTITINNIEQVETTRLESLKKLVTIFEKNIPAIFLYQPVYHYAIDTKKIKNVSIMRLGVFADRFSSVADWYITQQKIMNKPVSLGNFIRWVQSTW